MELIVERSRKVLGEGEVNCWIDSVVEGVELVKAAGSVEAIEGV